MRSIKHKPQFLIVILGSFLAVGFSLMSTAPALAAKAAKGTCILVGTQGQASAKIASCKSFMPSGKDSAGTKFNPGKCYELDQERGSYVISQAISCSAKELTGPKKALCPDNTLAPDNNASKCTASTGVVPTNVSGGAHQCGGTDNGNTPVGTSIDFGCRGKGNPILDLTFGIIRFLSNGVGLVVVGSIVYAGIQYTASRADPQAVAAAQNRIRSSIIALVIYIFAYAILNYVIPNGFLK